MNPEPTAAEQIEKMLRIRNTKAKTAIKVKNPDTGKDEVKLVPYQANRDGFYYDNEKRKWVLGIDPSGNIVPVMLSNCRDPETPSPQEALHMRAREDKGWLWVERMPYGFQGDWATERAKVVEQRRAEHHAKARKDAPDKMQQLAAGFHGEIRTLIESLGVAARVANEPAKVEKTKVKDAG